MKPSKSTDGLRISTNLPRLDANSGHKTSGDVLRVRAPGSSPYSSAVRTFGFFSGTAHVRSLPRASITWNSLESLPDSSGDIICYHPRCVAMHLLRLPLTTKQLLRGPLYKSQTKNFVVSS